MRRWGSFEEHPKGSGMYRLRRRVGGRQTTLVTGIPDHAAEAAMRETAPNGRCVCFFKAGPLVKIGWSDDHEKRKRQLELARGDSLELLCTMPGGRCMEQAIHAALADYRLDGEWFHGGGKVAKLIHGIRFAAKGAAE
jgi:hypothetical protein